MLIHETLLEAARARLAATGFAGGNLEKHRDPPTQDDDLPLAGITYETDTADADGDPRTGTSRFAHKLTLVIDVLDTGATGKAVMAKLAQHGQHVMAALCTDPWVWGATAPGEGVEGIAAVRQLTDKSPEGARIVYRRQVQIDLLFRSQWDPATDGLPLLDDVSVDAGDGIGSVVPLP